MHLTHLNIENLTSLWQNASLPYGSPNVSDHYTYCYIKDSNWPNRLWFNQDIDESVVTEARLLIQEQHPDLIIPYWDIHNSNSFEIMEQNQFKKIFEQIGMSLKPVQMFDQSPILSIKLVPTQAQATSWSKLFQAAFGYHINSDILLKSHQDIDYFIVYDKEKPVGTVITHQTGQVLGIHALGIIPQHRRKGYAEQIMKALINEASLNNQLVTLQASNMGKHLYLKLGFTEQFIIKNYIAEP